MKKTTFTGHLAYFACAAALVGCATADQTPTTSGAAPFLRVDKPEGLKLDTLEKLDSMAVKADRAESDKDFYIAVHKDVLGGGRKFFMSAYMKTLNTDLSGASGAYSMGTRVVSLEAQNGSVLVFDVDDTRLQTEAFDSQIVLDAFPIVSNYDAFNGGENAEDYVLIDPAGGKNEFTIFGHASRVPFEDGHPSQAVDVHVAFLQDFQEVEDGILFEKVFAGTATEGTQLENVYGTLGIGFRNYKESEGFVESVMPEVPHYFGAKSRVGKPSDLEPNPIHPVGKWHIHPGMEPIEWVISPLVRELQKDPLLEGVDLEKAFVEGIENWNSVFGFEVLKARIATSDESFSDDTVNYMIVDYPGFLGGFADWRINPNSGEIRGASVILSADLPALAAQYVYPEEQPAPGPDLAAPENLSALPAAHSRLHWGPMPGGTLCHYELNTKELIASARSGVGQGVRLDELSREEKIERFLMSFVIHEIGHTLGLRHNFKGSLMPGSSSVMDYLDDQTDSLQRHVPGTYDISAVRWLYGLQSELPSDPFCTDDNVWGRPLQGVAGDADCMPFDRGEHPLTDTHAPAFAGQVQAYLTGELPFPESRFEESLPFRMYTIARYAWYNHPDALLVPEILLDGVGVPVDPERVVAESEFGRRADVVTRIVLKELMDSFLYELDPEYFVNEQIPLFLPRENVKLTSAIMRQLSGVLVNEDKIRSFESRRLAVDLLKMHQSDEALEVLSQAKVIIDGQLAAEPSVAMQELANQVNAALNPYFE